MRAPTIHFVQVADGAAGLPVNYQMSRRGKLHAVNFTIQNISAVQNAGRLQFRLQGRLSLSPTTQVIEAGIEAECYGCINNAVPAMPTREEAVTLINLYEWTQISMCLPDLWFDNGTTISVTDVVGNALISNIGLWFEFEE